jgi:thiol:disulfide interchange protein DsbC
LQKSSKSIIINTAFILVIFFSGSHYTYADEVVDPNIKFLQDKLKDIIPSYKFDKIKKSPLDNIYEIVYGGEIIYITSDAQFLFESGNLQKIIKGKDSYYFENLTESSASEGRKNLLGSLPDSKFFVYGDSKDSYINVVTDIDCSYCRKFHNDIETYEKNGVKVRYLVFAIKTGAKRKVISAWCSNNKNEAFTLLKKEKAIKQLNCDNPIDEHQNIISSIGVSSTPSIFLPSGELIQGYMSPAEVIQKLKN